MENGPENNPASARTDRLPVKSVTYTAGVCNIGRAEARRRYVFGIICLAATLALWWYLDAWFAPPIWRLTLLGPASLSALGFIQAQAHFCANYGMTGRYNVSVSVGVTQPVIDEAMRAKDRHKSWVIIGYSFLIGAAIALIAAIMP